MDLYFNNINVYQLSRGFDPPLPRRLAFQSFDGSRNVAETTPTFGVHRLAPAKTEPNQQLDPPWNRRLAQLASNVVGRPIKTITNRK